MSGLPEFDTIAAVMEDAQEVFCYDREMRPQDRAHAYLVKYRVQRGYDDTAMQAAVGHMVARAHAIGMGHGADSANLRRQLASIRDTAQDALLSLEGDEA